MMIRMTTFATATAMAWELAGRPERPSLTARPAPAPCAVCGAVAGLTVDASATIGGGSFADHHLLAAPSSDRTCYPCAWAMAGRPPSSLRNWTAACAPGADLGPSNPKAAAAVPGAHPGLLLTARDDMRAVARLLAAPPDGPWVLAVAESGQKHSLPWARVNYGAARWTVRMDAADVTAAPGEFAMVLGRCASLRLAKFTTPEITALAPSAGKLKGDALAAWLEHSPPLAPFRESALIRLACFMITKGNADELAARYRP